MGEGATWNTIIIIHPGGGGEAEPFGGKVEGFWDPSPPELKPEI